MRKFELKILIIILAIFLLLFVFIPEGKEDTIFNESENISSSNSINIERSDTNVIVKQIISGNQSNEVLNLSKKDEFVEDKLLKESNNKFNELINSSK